MPSEVSGRCHRPVLGCSAARTPESGDEHNDALFTSLSGLDIGYRPLFWQPYEKSVPAALARARPIVALGRSLSGARVTSCARSLSEIGADQATDRFLPTIARGDWSAVIDKEGRVLGYLPVDGFF